MRNWPEQWHCVVRAAYRERKQARAMRSPAAYFVRDRMPDGFAKPCIGGWRSGLFFGRFLTIAFHLALIEAHAERY